MKKWSVVTGGAGFIGSALVRQLNDLGKTRLLIVDNLGSDERWKNLVGKQFEEIIQIEQLWDWLASHKGQIETIFHLGACSDTQEVNADYLLRNNTHYTIRLAQFAIDHAIRFIYASSAATYGDGAQGFEDDMSQLENLRPLNMYGYSKHLVDLYFHRQGYFDRVIGLKYFNVFGPNEYHKGRMASALVKMAQDARVGPVKLFKSTDAGFTDGEQKRDFIYIKDVVAMTAALADNEVCGLYNVGSGEASSWNRLAKALQSPLGHPIAIEYIDMPASLHGKYQNYTKAQMSRWQDRALLMPRYSLEEAVHDYVERYLLARQIY